VGRALAHVLALLPLNLIWVDPRAQEFGQPPAGVDVRVTSDWSAVMESLPAGSGVLVLTPDHVLDALITEAALCNDNLVYVGLIGSATKRRRFEHAFRATGVAEGRIQALVCPIGERGIKDKRPEVIAALVAAEVVERLLHPSGGGGESGGC
jgi:xanthine dehydrogenase accessory factor